MCSSSRSSDVTRECTIFPIRSGVLHAEDVSLPALADEVGTPFYCYSTATLERHYRVFAEAFQGLDALVCFAIKSNSNLAVLRTLGALGAGMDVVSQGELRRARAAGIRGGENRLLRHRQDARGDRLCARAKAFSRSTSSRKPNCGPCRRSPHRWGRRRASRSASIPMSTPRPTARFPRAGRAINSAFPGRRRRAFTISPAICPASRRSASICILAARSPISAPLGNAFSLIAQLVGIAAGGRAPDRIRQCRRRSRRALSRRYRAAAAARTLCRRRARETRRPRLPAAVRARPHDRRQCGHSGLAASSTGKPAAASNSSSSMPR